MDEDKYLILIKGEDKTARIAFFEVRDSVVWITYKSSTKVYPCALRDCMILDNPVITDITEENVVYLNDIPLFKQRSTYASENIMWTLLGEILQETRYNGLECRDQVLIRNLFNDMNRLGDEERRYVNNGASVDFVIYHKLDKSPVLIIEVDGFSFHENNPQQLERDRLKDRIFDTYGLPLLRLPTTGSGEEQRIRMKLDEALKK